MLPQLVVFDMAGTTVFDSDFVSDAVVSGFGAHSISIEVATVNPYMGIPKPLAIQSILADMDDWRADDPDFVDSIHDKFLVEMVKFYQEDPNVRAIDGATDVFAELRIRGILIALDTGFSRDIADTILTRLGWDESVIDFSVTSDEVLKGRPHPDMILAAMGALGVTDPASVAKVGDTPSDIDQGIAAGCGWTIGVWEGTHSREQLAACSPTHLIANVSQLLTVFGTES